MNHIDPSNHKCKKNLQKRKESLKEENEENSKIKNKIKDITHIIYSNKDI